MQVIKNRLIWIVILILAIVLVLLSFSFYNYRNGESNKTSSGIVWSDEDDIREEKGIDYISIPGFSSLDFVANSTTQSVSFYNPENNDYYMNLQITIDDDLIWECDNLYPGYGYDEIELIHTLDKGKYSATYKVRCFDIDTGNEANGCEVNFDLYVN